MKFLKVDGESLVFYVGRREKALLLEVLDMYPVLPIAHHRLSTSTDSPAMEADQKLLEEALAEHRSENKKALDAMLSDPKRFEEMSGGHRLCLSSYEVEWLLQVLNDIRVGSWLKLGSPDEEQGYRLHLDPQNTPHLWAMELCGHFQFALLAAKET